MQGKLVTSPIKSNPAALGEDSITQHKTTERESIMSGGGALSRVESSRELNSQMMEQSVTYPPPHRWLKKKRIMGYSHYLSFTDYLL